MIASETVRAGDGTFVTTNGIDGTFNFCIVLRFHATEAQLDYLRRGFQRGSDVLADATDGHHRFGVINIVNDCTNGCAAAAAAEFYVDNTPQSNGAAAYGSGYGVHQLMGGFSIHIFEKIANDQLHIGAYPTYNLDYAGFTVAHEFAHQAYGVLDEYNGIDLTKPPGQQNVPNNANCAPGSGPNTPPMDSPSLNYCLMDNYQTRGGMTVVDSQSRRMTLKEFCVPSNHDPDHNNYQSFFKHESCWETIFHLNKLWRLPLPPGGLPNPNTPPSQPVTFGTACGDQKVVMVIDRSGSMTSESRLDFVKLGATLFIKDFRSDGYLGLISFSDDVRVDFPLTKLSDDSKRNAAATAVNSLVAAGNTDIGDGLLKALAELSGQNDCTSCSKTIILLTDGDHNTGTPPEAVTEQLKTAKIRVTAVVIGNEISVAGETSLKNIANQTGGEFYRLPAAIEGLPGSGPTGLQSLFLSLANRFNGDTVMGGQPDSIASGQVKEIPVFFEQGVAVATFSVTKADLTDNITLSLRSPSGSIFNQFNSQAVESFGNPAPENADSLTLSNSQLIRVPNPQAGIWTMVITAGSARTGKIETMASADHSGVGLNVDIGNQEAIFSPAPVEVHATAMFEGARTVGANITGSVKRPDGSVVAITLFDDGLLEHGDFLANDGIYSASFNNYSTDGTYVFDLTVTNSSGRTYEGEFTDPSFTKSVPPFTRKGSTTAVVSGIVSGEAAWLEDFTPRGATAHGDSDGGASSNGEGDGWYWVNANPGPFSGGLAHQSTLRSGFHQHYFEGATNSLQQNIGDKLFSYVFLDINHMPDEILLQWNDGNNWEHRAYWGANVIAFGTNGTNSRRYMGPLPPAGQWVRLEVPASEVGLEQSYVTGMAFGLFGGRATWDRSGRLLPDAPPLITPGYEYVWVEDAVPPGSILETVGDQWLWLPPHFSGQLGHRSVFQPGYRSHSFRAAQTPMTIQPGDVLFTYVFVDINHVPNELVLRWHDGSSWEHSAYWGQNFLDKEHDVNGQPLPGTTGTENRRFMGGIPPGSLNNWYRLEVPAS
ncbi:MAG TPA: VWA domain-containing protein, partial [Pyrinomonadaceae bacterium]|nr:VWA domain-containing protein [Pyrinomonadaceae bacterium]